MPVRREIEGENDMPKGGATTVFVSSTCYDLNQLRADLRDFAESIGFEPVLSELDTFPVDPSADTVQNCINAVRTRADVFVLVVGGRYGTISDTGKSITNMEYLEAAARGVPKYVFVKSEILSFMPFWRDNPDADFSSVVDTTKLFEFVAHLRDKGEVWVFPFNNAQDICKTLRKQLSYLFANCLDLRLKLQKQDIPALQLGPESLKIYIEKPKGWEYLVLAKVMQERVQALDYRRLDAELGISFGSVTEIPDGESAVNWILSKVKQISQIAQHLSRALNLGIEGAVGKPGEPGDIQRIIHLASKIADGYAQVLDWTLEFTRLEVNPQFDKLVNLAAQFSSNMLKEIEQFAIGLYDQIEQTLINPPTDGVANFTLTLTVPDMTKFHEEMQNVNERLRGF